MMPSGTSRRFSPSGARRLEAKQPLPNLPGQALYLARNAMLGAAKDLTDAVPSRIGGPNKFDIPPAYFDAANEPLLDEYVKLFALMQAPPADAQKSETPFKDVVDLGNRDCAGQRASMRRLPKRRAASASGCSLPKPTATRTSAMRARTNTRAAFRPARPKTRTAAGNGLRSRARSPPSIPRLSLRDDKEEARAGSLDHRYNHWTAVRDALMNAHADIFPQVPAIVKTLPDPIDQMKLFELIQIVPAPTRSALGSGNLLGYRVSDPTIMRYLRNNSMFAFGQADRARTSATLPRNSRCDVAVQSQIRTGACPVQRGQGAVDSRRMLSYAAERRERESLRGKQALPSSGRKFTRSRVRLQGDRSGRRVGAAADRGRAMPAGCRISSKASPRPRNRKSPRRRRRRRR